MAKKISQLPAGTAVDDASLFEGVEGGVSVQYTGAQLAAYAGGGGSGGAIAEWSYISTTTPPPISGNFRLDNATQTLATTLWLNVITAMAVDVTRYLATIGTGDRFLIQKKGDSTTWQLYEVTGTPTDNTTYFTFPVAWQDGGTALTTTTRCVIWHLPASGGGSGDVVGPSSSVASEVALFDGTSGKLLKRATGTGYAKLTSGVQSADSTATVRADLQGTGLTSAEVGFRNIPQNSQSAAYTTVAADAGKHIFHPAADANARTYTIDSNANVAYPVGAAITFVNETSQVVSIAITSDTLTLAGSTTTGTRSLAQNGVATALKITSTKWIISGTGLS